MGADHHGIAGESRAKRNALRWVALALAFSPALLLAALVYENSTNVPHWDDWELLELVLRLRDGTLNIAEFTTPHVEHRWALTRVVSLGLNLASNCNMQAHNAAGVLFAMASSVLLYSVLKRTVQPWGRRCFAWFLINVALFTTAQWQNWLWPVNMAYFLCLLGLTLALWATARFGPHPRTLVWCAGGGVLASFSFSAGIAVWPALLPVAAWISVRRRSPWPTVSWILISATVVGIYFLDPVSTAEPSHTPSGDGRTGFADTALLIRQSPTAFAAGATAFAATLQGNPLARGTYFATPSTAFALGIAAWCAIVLLFVQLLRRGNVARWDSAIPWFALIGFGSASVAVIALGRFGLGGEGAALFIRYVTFTNMTFVGLTGAAAVCLGPLKPGGRQRDLSLVTCGLCVGGYLLLQLCNWQYGARQMVVWRWAREQGRAALQFINVLPEIDTWQVEGSPHYLRKIAGPLAASGRLGTRLLTDRRLANFKIRPEVMKESRGEFQALETERPDDAVAKGFAFLDGNDRPADAILFTIEQDGEPFIFDLAQSTPLSPQVGSISGRDFEFTRVRQIRKREFVSWEKRLDLTRVTPGKHRVSAWMFEYARSTVRKLPGDFEITVPPRNTAMSPR